MNETDSPPQFILLYYFIILLLFVISNVVKRWRFFVRFLGDTKDIIDKYRIQKNRFFSDEMAKNYTYNIRSTDSNRAHWLMLYSGEYST